MNVISVFFSAVFFVAFTQNIVLTGGYGSSETIRSAARPKQIILFALMISFFATITSLICRVLMFIPQLKEGSTIVSLAVYTAVLTVIYFITVGVMKILLKKSDWSELEEEKFFRQTAVAAFNTIVLAIPFINQRATYSVVESIGQGIGSGIAFLIATYLVYLGMRKLEANDEMPKSFKGTPALFMYIAILCIAFTGITGKSLFF